MKHEDLTYRIIGSAMEVHKYLGNRFQEVISQRALAIIRDIAHEGLSKISIGELLLEDGLKITLVDLIK